VLRALRQPVTAIKIVSSAAIYRIRGFITLNCLPLVW